MSLLDEEIDGKKSFRRTIALIIIIFAMVLVILDTFTEYKVNETIWLSLFGGGISIVLSTIVKNRKQNNNEFPN